MTILLKSFQLCSNSRNHKLQLRQTYFIKVLRLFEFVYFRTRKILFLSYFQEPSSSVLFVSLLSLITLLIIYLILSANLQSWTLDTFLIPTLWLRCCPGGGAGGGWWGDERREEFSLSAVAPGLSGRPQQSALTSTERRDGTRGKGQAFSGWAEEKQWERGNHRQGSDLTEKAVGRGGASSVN